MAFRCTNREGIRTAEGALDLPRDGEGRELLRTKRWLPLRGDGAVAPNAVLIVPEELQGAVAGLATAGALGGKQLPEAIDPRTWRLAEQVVREILGRMGRERQVQRLLEALIRLEFHRPTTARGLSCPILIALTLSSSKTRYRRLSGDIPGGIWCVLPPNSSGGTTTGQRCETPLNL